MTNIVIQDLEFNEQLDHSAMTTVKGGSANWVYGWIRPYQTSRGVPGAGGINISNSIINLQFANQTIIGGDGPINAINAPVASPSSTLNENMALTAISQTAIAQIS